MSLERFSNISRVLAFDDRQRRRSEQRGDKLAPIRTFYEQWTQNLQLLYVPSANITIDEQLIPFRGRCPFKVYIPSKPGKYGMKAWIAADSDTAFCLQFQIYLGKVGDNAERNQGERVVLDLVSSYRGRNVTTDNFFTSHNLALELLKQKITIVGKVRNNKRFLPVHATSQELRKLPIHSSKFFFHEKETVVLYVPKKYRMIYLLSTLHHNSNILEDHPKKIPEIIEYYNSTKGGVDTLDQMVRTYSCKRKTNRWPVALFSNLLDISALNAFIIWTEIYPEWQKNKLHKRRLFLEQLGEVLAQEYIKRRSRLPRAEASTSLVRRIREEDSASPSTNSPSPKRKCASERKRCKFCPSKKEKKTFTECITCKKPVCPSHRHTTTLTTTYCIDHKP